MEVLGDRREERGGMRKLEGGKEIRKEAGCRKRGVEIRKKEKQEGRERKEGGGRKDRQRREGK